jgi:AAA domain
MDLDQRILRVLETTPGSKAKDIAAQLAVDRTLVRSALYGTLRAKVRQDNMYRWYPRVDGQPQPPEDTGGNTLLALLCGYYLDCLSHGDLDGVSEFASSKYGEPNYLELSSLPMSGVTDPFDSDPGRQLITRIRRDRNRQTLFLGYPVRLHLIRSAKGWEGFKVEPLFLFVFDEIARNDAPVLTRYAPQINFKALRALTNAQESLMEEAIQLAEELGLGNASGEEPDIDELIARLREIRPEWDWQEETTPSALSNARPLCDMTEQGIFNRAIVVAAERSPYTKGLESELAKLQSLNETEYRDSALGQWLTELAIDEGAGDQQPMLEVLPLNSEQRQAVRQALSNRLTVITGPPGTGKSQVVTSILVNAARQGKTVLFASKNNKAIDVVETRVNALGPRPILLRLGSNEFQAKLADYLIALLASTAAADDFRRYSECESIQNRLQHRSEEISSELKAFIDLRNAVDSLDQRIEPIRQELGDELFHHLKTFDSQTAAQRASAFQVALRRANPRERSFVGRLFWPLVRNARLASLASAGKSIEPYAREIGLLVPNHSPDLQTIDEWLTYGASLAARMSLVSDVREYFDKLSSLSKARSLEELSKIQKRLTDEIAEHSEALWEAWLRVQPSRITPAQRSLLRNYSALLQMIVSANATSSNVGRDVFRRYHELFPQITQILPCWAVTSLSVRGKVPFEPSCFDLLVIDEASQCDIASALPLLYRAKRVAVIGDPMQLKHISTLPKQQDQQLLGKHELIDTMLGGRTLLSRSSISRAACAVVKISSRSVIITALMPTLSSFPTRPSTAGGLESQQGTTICVDRTQTSPPYGGWMFKVVHGVRRPGVQLMKRKHKQPSMRSRASSIRTIKAASEWSVRFGHKPTESATCFTLSPDWLHALEAPISLWTPFTNFKATNGMS